MTSTNPSTRVLVVEDEENLRLALVDALESEGYAVIEAADGDAGLALALSEGPDAILLDLMLPGRDGFSVLRELRRDRLDAAVLILSARGAEWDRIQGFEVGADDYLVKPFSVPELLARLAAVLARTRGAAPGLCEPASRVTIGGAIVDFEAYRIERGGEALGISRLERDLLAFLIQNPGRTLPRERLLDEVWGKESFPTERTVDNHVAKLRKKLELDPKAPAHLITVHGVGYRFER